jgi:hypothetical protein
MALTGLAVLILALNLPGGFVLKAEGLKTGIPLLVLPLTPGERFTLRYYHSVENAPIWEEHSVDSQGRIHIEQERYLKFGAGMGRMPGVGRLVRRGPYEVIENMHWPTGDFILRVGSSSVAHTVIWRGKEFNLSAVAPHRAVQFTAQPVTLLYYWWRWVWPHPTLRHQNWLN